MQQAITIKTKLLVDSNMPEFDYLTKQFRDACNFVSDWIFNHDFELNQIKINHELYYQIRRNFKLKAQLTQSVIRSVVARYRTVRTQLANKPYRVWSGKYDKNGHKIYLSIARDLTWLWQPIRFKKPQADLQRNRDWSLTDGKLSINTLGKRVKTAYICRGFDQYLDGSWKFGLAKLIKHGKHWYFYISASKELPDYNKDQTKHVIGIDRGLRFLTVCYDEQGKTLFQSGKKVLQTR